MFEFGSVEDTKRLYWENSISQRGPAVPDVHYTEMGLDDLRNLFAYLYMSLSKAIGDKLSQDVIDSITYDYDLVFEHLASVSEEFRQAVAGNRHGYLPGWDPETIAKYKKLAGVNT